MEPGEDAAGYDDYGEEIVCRRATLDDVWALKILIGQESFIFDKRYGGGKYSLKNIIESSYFSVSACNQAGDILGFCAFSDTPTLVDEIPDSQWPEYIHEYYEETGPMSVSNTLWLTFFVSEPLHQDGVINSVFRTLYVTLADTEFVLFALPRAAPPFSPIQDYFVPLRARSSLEKLIEAGEGFDGTLYWSPRQDVIPDLVIRIGKVEDYDDLMPLLLGETGVLTEMGDDFYLDELLEHQDAQHAVLVAEDSETAEIVGLMCMSSKLEDQQYVVKHFNFEPYHKLRRIHVDKDNTEQRGNKNSFQITFFYLNPDYECRASDFLRPAFELFPNTEYSFIRLPHSISDHALLTKFQYVPLKAGLTLKLGCYVICRYALDEMQTRLSVPEDIPLLTNLLMTQSEVSRARSDATIANTKACTAEQPPEREFALSLVHYTNVVGILVVRSLLEDEAHNLTANFDVDTKIDLVAVDKNAEDEYQETNLDPTASTRRQNATPLWLLVKYFYIKPIYGSYTRTFLREALRFLGKEVLYYVVGLKDEVSNTLMSELTLALPRRVTDKPDETGPLEHSELLTLHFSSRKLLSEFKTKIHTRIVVIGASTTGLSFIYTLLSLPYLHFSNIVMISRDGIPEHPNHAEHAWFADTLDFLEREFILFKLRGKVRIIEGTMVDFERNEKYIVTDNGYVEPYDHLVVTAGRQYTIPKELAVTRHLAKNGVFPLSSQTMIDKIKQHVHESEIYEDDMSNCVIYGSSLDSYCVTTSLIELGVKASRIVLVSPAQASQSPFRDPNIDMKVDKLCESLGIKIYKFHELERMDYNDDNNLTAIYISNRANNQHLDPHLSVSQEGFNQGRLVEIPCTMFVYCYEKDIDPAILSALNKRSIVFDGRVIVENNYRTTDPQIYAAGPIAMFSRRFGPSEPFEDFSSMEVGTKLCNVVLGFLGVEEFKHNVADETEDGELHGIDHEQLRKERRGQLFAEENKDPSAGGADDNDVIWRPKPLPHYNNNRMWSITLPMGYHYFHCEIQDCTAVSVAKGTTITTEDDEGDNYIRVSVNTNNIIQSLSYLSSHQGEVHNFKVLVGLSQTYLNIVQRWNDGLISDVVSFLRQSWATAIYYDKFQRFAAYLKEKFRAQRDVQILKGTIMDYVESEDVDKIDERQRRFYAQDTSSETQHMIQLELIKFLHQNKHFLPSIYFLPDISSHVN
eukprot:TRINITY_DN66647_c7_g1_i1.p1 TRINITY_DN66647_c7_g1~~TRINITY_DN66647_c7_g1_i1.p1  ORF type:complete len:1197 (+),score=144.15 TRINITY_DN66647_c7_g1_i1:43-3633(+)